MTKPGLYGTIALVLGILLVFFALAGVLGTLERALLIFGIVNIAEGQGLIDRVIRARGAGVESA